MGCTRQLSRRSFDRRWGRRRAGSALRLLAVLAVATLWLSGREASAASYGPIAWGDNNYGQLGNGEFEGFRIAPVAVGKLGEEVTVGDEVAAGEESMTLAAGYEHGLALLRNGKVMAWGENGFGQLGDGTGLGPETCVFFSECSTVPVEVKGLDEATAIAAGYYFSLALLSSGKVMAWGDGGSGQLGDESEFTSDVPKEVRGLGEATAIAGGVQHSLALLKNGTIMAWGSDEYGQLGDGDETKSDIPVEVQGLHEVTAIAAGASHSLALLKSGTVMAWGENASGQLGDGNETNSDVPVEVTGLSEVTAIASDGNHSLALLKDGKVMTWGNNNAGQLGNGNEVNSDVPVEAKGLSGVKAIAAGVQHSLALLHDGKVMAWGDDGWGELGNGNEDRESSDVPVQASELSEVTAIAAGGYSSYAEQGEIGEVTGEVTSAATSGSIEGAKVCAMNVNGGEPWRCATTDAAGEYTVTVHESGGYDVRFSAPPGSGYLASEYYNGKLSSSEETAVPVALGATASGASGLKYFTASDTAADLVNAINRDRQPERSQRIKFRGMQQKPFHEPTKLCTHRGRARVEGWHKLSALGGSSTNLQLYTTYQPLPPEASTSAASSITEEQATLNGTVNPKGTTTHYHFQYGTTTAYGSSTSEGNAGSSTSSVPESATVTG